MSFDVSHPEVRDAVQRALAEDIGSGDLTTQFCIPAERVAVGRMIAREPMVIAGTELLPLILDLTPELLVPSGTSVEPGAVVAEFRGSARALLTAERTALNFVQRLSGIATLARAYVQAVEGTGARILDTRKTTPGLRRLEKMAAAAGGVVNHRMGLYDAILIKNNHIVAAGGVSAALLATRDAGLPVEIEVRTLEELEEALSFSPALLLLDNLTPAQARDWIGRIAGRVPVELSGGITLQSVRAYAEAGPDFISCGAITHSAQAMDLNFRCS